MAVNLKSTRGAHADGVKILVYAGAGYGKTTLIGTLPDPIIISAEAGLLSLSDLDIPYIEVTDMNSLKEAYNFIAHSKEAAGFKSVAIDSISEIAEVVLSAEKKINKDVRQAYGALMEQVTDLVRAFRDLSGRHVYMAAKMEKMQDETGRVLYGPAMPGTKLGQQLAYYFDEVFCLRVEKDEDGKTTRMLQTEADPSYGAKDRSGKLPPWIEPDLSKVIGIISGEQK